MAELDVERLGGLPANVATVLSAFLKRAQSFLGPNLVSIVLYGSGAERKLSTTSDINDQADPGIVHSLVAARDGRAPQGGFQNARFQLIELTMRISERASRLS